MASGAPCQQVCWLPCLLTVVTTACTLSPHQPAAPPHHHHHTPAPQSSLLNTFTCKRVAVAADPSGAAASSITYVPKSEQTKATIRACAAACMGGAGA